MSIRRILIILPMHEKLKVGPRNSFSFPWGIASVAAHFQQAGFEVRILDAQAAQMPQEAVVAELDKYEMDAVGLSAFSTQFGAVRLMAAHLKRRGLPVVVGGPLATYQPELVLKATEADVCVIGDGEISGPETFLKYPALDSVRGIAFRSGADVVMNAPQDQMTDMDALLPTPFELFNMPAYLSQNNPYAGRRSTRRAMSFLTSRGCPYSCRFCSKSFRVYRAMSPGRTYELLRELRERFQVEEISFSDELFFASKDRFRELAPLLGRLGLVWGAQCRVNMADAALLSLAKRHGCIGVGYGIESGSQKILDNMNKRTTVAQIEDAMRLARQLKLPVKAQLIFGYPGEDETTVQETVDLFRRVDHPGKNFTVITPVPGSPLYDECRSRGLIPDEPAYLCALEKSFGYGRVHVNFTPWPDEEIYPRKMAAEEAMAQNYVNNSVLRKWRWRLTGQY